MAPIPAVPPAPYPEAHVLDELLADAIAASDLDAVLAIVQDFALRHPKPDRALLLPTPAVLGAMDPAITRPLQPHEDGSWFHLLLYNAGNAALRAGQNQLAVELYKQALLECAHPSLYNNLGSAYRRLGRYSEARRWFEQAIASDPSFLPGYLRAAAVILVAGQAPDEAQRHLESYIAQGGEAELALRMAEQMPPEHAALAGPMFAQYFPVVPPAPT